MQTPPYRCKSEVTPGNESFLRACVEVKIRTSKLRTTSQPDKDGPTTYTLPKLTRPSEHRKDEARGSRRSAYVPTPREQCSISCSVAMFGQKSPLPAVSSRRVSRARGKKKGPRKATHTAEGWKKSFSPGYLFPGIAFFTQSL